MADPFSGQEALKIFADGATELLVSTRNPCFASPAFPDCPQCRAGLAVVKVILYPKSGVMKLRCPHCGNWCKGSHFDAGLAEEPYSPPWKQKGVMGIPITLGTGKPVSESSRDSRLCVVCNERAGREGPICKLPSPAIHSPPNVAIICGFCRPRIDSGDHQAIVKALWFTHAAMFRAKKGADPNSGVIAEAVGRTLARWGIYK